MYGYMAFVCTAHYLHLGESSSVTQHNTFSGSMIKGTITFTHVLSILDQLIEKCYDIY